MEDILKRRVNLLSLSALASWETAEDISVQKGILSLFSALIN